MDLSSRAGDLRCDGQDGLAEGVYLAVGYHRDVGEADELGPADEVGRGEHELESCLVLWHGPAGEVGQPCSLSPADAVLNPRVAAVAQLQALGGELPRAGAGDESRVPPAVVALEEAELSTGVGAFPTHDDQRALRPGRKVQQVGSPRPREHLPSPRRLALPLRTTPLLGPWGRQAHLFADGEAEAKAAVTGAAGSCELVGCPSAVGAYEHFGATVFFWTGIAGQTSEGHVQHLDVVSRSVGAGVVRPGRASPEETSLRSKKESSGW